MNDKSYECVDECGRKVINEMAWVSRNFILSVLIHVVLIGLVQVVLQVVLAVLAVLAVLEN